MKEMRGHGGRKPVLQLALDGTLIKEWESEFAAATGSKTSQANISLCCTHSENHYTAGGYRWMFKEVEKKEQVSSEVPKRRTRARAVLQYTKDGEFVREWESITAVRKENGFLAGTISTCCQLPQRSAYGFKWRYKE